jgi:hypothetical protein
MKNVGRPAPARWSGSTIPAASRTPAGEKAEMTEQESSLPEGKTELIDRICLEWKTLSVFVVVMKAEDLVRREAGEWSVKDILAHLAFWERSLIVQHFLGMPMEEAFCLEEDVLKRADENEINAILFERSRDRDLLEVLSDWLETHRWLISELAKLGEDELRKPVLGIGLGPDPVPLGRWIAVNSCDHYVHHRRTIEARMADGQGSDGE